MKNDLTDFFTRALLFLAVPLAFLSGPSSAFGEEFIRENRGAFSYPQSGPEQLERQSRDNEAAEKASAGDLALVKFDLVNGDLLKAKSRLEKTGNFAAPVRRRYMAIIEFIRGNYRQSLEHLKSEELSRETYQDKICLLKTFNLLILDRAEDAAGEWAQCEKYLAGKDGGENLWTNALLGLKRNRSKKRAIRSLRDARIQNQTGDTLRRLLKLALYLEEPKIPLKKAEYFSTEILENPRTRELLGLLYFRDLQFAKAYNLIEDLSTPNSENIKGNILLAQKKYELAYAQFKLALKRKNNSQNALERIVPAAWRLNQWQEGGKFAALLEETDSNRTSKRALEAAFLTKQNRPDQALKKLKTLANKTKEQALQVNQLIAYNALALGDNALAFERADRACEQQDAFHCWLRTHLILWEDFAALAKQGERIAPEPGSMLAKYRKDFKADPIKERVYIKQEEIEEMEDAMIELSAGTR